MSVIGSIIPKQVEPKSAWRWVLMAIDLAGRRTLLWLSFTLCMSVVMLLVKDSYVLTNLISIATLFIVTIIAESVDDTVPPSYLELIRLIYRAMPKVLYATSLFLLILCSLQLIYNVIFYDISKYLELFYEHTPYVSSGETFRGAIANIFSPAMSGLIVGYLNITCGFAWFYFSLYYFLGAVGVHGWYLAYHGLIINLRTIVPLLIVLSILSMVLCVIFPLLAPILYCIFGAILYVSFREVYLEREDNEPISSKSISFIDKYSVDSKQALVHNKDKSIHSYSKSR